jgi:hypothetical protein
MVRKTNRIWIALVWGIAFIAFLFLLWLKAVIGILEWTDLLGLILFATLGGVGTLLVTRQPANPVGWTFFAAFCYVIFDTFLEALSLLYLERSSEITFVSERTVAFIHAYKSEILSVVVWCSLLVFPILYFPNGQLLSRRWRYFLWLIIALLVLFTIGGVFSPELVSERFPEFQNPLSVLLAGQILAVVNVFLVFFLLVPPLTLVLRFRGANAVERQQIKWPLFSALIIAIGIGLGILAAIIVGQESLVFQIGVALEALGLMSFPITIGIAILRYRLYDIDLVISRTLLYTALTALLGLVYYTSVVFLQQFFPVDSPVAVVLSTLAVAALFAPLRRRIQDFIDRRFYRRRYDAEQTLATFSAKLRDEVDQDELTKAILDTVKETLQPREVTLWWQRSETGVRQTE